jgi:hypothetical protein
MQNLTHTPGIRERNGSHKFCKYVGQERKVKKKKIHFIPQTALFNMRATYFV